MKVPWPLSEPRSFGLASGLKGFTPSSQTRNPIRNSGWDIEPLGPAPLYSGYSLRDGLAFRTSGGIAPPLTCPRANQISPLASWNLPRPRRLGTRSKIQGGICAPEDLPLRQSSYPSRMKDLPRPRRLGRGGI